MQRRSRLIKGWDTEPDDVPRPLSVPLPDYANEDRTVGRLTTAMSSIVFPDYEEINDELITKRPGSKSKENLQREKLKYLPPQPLHLSSTSLRN